MTTLRRFALTIALLAGFQGAALAQKESAPKATKTETKSKKAKKATKASKGAKATPEKKSKNIDFADGDDINGELRRPDGDDVFVAEGAAHTSLIKLRVNFIPEILKSAEQF